MPLPRRRASSSTVTPAARALAAAMCVVGLRPSTSRMRAPSSRARQLAGSSAVVLPRVKRTSRRPVRSSTRMNDVGETLPGSISTDDTSTPNAFRPRMIISPNSSSDRRPK